MFALPSMWNLVISTIVFIIAVWYFHRYMEQQGFAKGMTRSLLVFVLASIVSWGSGEVVDWTQEKIEGPKPVTQAPADMSQLLKALGQSQP